MAETTHILCAHCNGDNTVSNYQESDVLTVIKIAGGAVIEFKCKHCGKEYPLLPFINEQENE